MLTYTGSENKQQNALIGNIFDSCRQSAKNNADPRKRAGADNSIANPSDQNNTAVVLLVVAGGKGDKTVCF